MPNAQSKPVVVRTNVPKLANYGDYREYLRFDFWYSCAYCSLTEIEAQGIGFEIDHFEPQALRAGNADAYVNLMWSCRVCNRCKSNTWPKATAERDGYRFIRPDIEDPADHYELVAYRLRPLTRPGEWTVEVLDLNRKTLRELRRLRERIYESSEDITRGLRDLAALRPDSFKATERQRFVKARERLITQGGALKNEDLSAAVIRVLSHSPLLDPDPEVRSRARQRREFLKKVQALAPQQGELEEQ